MISACHTDHLFILALHQLNMLSPAATLPVEHQTGLNYLVGQDIRTWYVLMLSL